MNKVISAILLTLCSPLMAMENPVTEQSPLLMMLPVEVRLEILDLLTPHERMRISRTSLQFHEETKDYNYWNKQAENFKIYYRKGDGYTVVTNYLAGLEYVEAFKNSTDTPEKRRFFTKAISCLNVPAQALYPDALDKLMALMSADSFMDVDFICLPAFCDQHFSPSFAEILTQEDYLKFTSNKSFSKIFNKPDTTKVLFDLIQAIKFDTAQGGEIHQRFVTLIKHLISLKKLKIKRSLFCGEIETQVKIVKDLTSQELNTYPLFYLDFLLSLYQSLCTDVNEFPITVAKTILTRSFTEDHPTPLGIIDILSDLIKNQRFETSNDLQNTILAAKMDDLFADTLTMSALIDKLNQFSDPFLPFYENYFQRGFYFPDYLEEHLDILLKKNTPNSLAQKLYLMLMTFKIMEQYPHLNNNAGIWDTSLPDLNTLFGNDDLPDNQRQNLIGRLIEAAGRPSAEGTRTIGITIWLHNLLTGNGNIEARDKIEFEFIQSIEGKTIPEHEKALQKAKFMLALDKLDEGFTLIDDLIATNQPNADKARKTAVDIIRTTRSRKKFSLKFFGYLTGITDPHYNSFVLEELGDFAEFYAPAKDYLKKFKEDLGLSDDDDSNDEDSV